MSINVNKITSTLAKLPDAQLQQYAQMHKNDPYIMALAMSESNRRKEMRAAGKGAQDMQEQPKVVDREIARMGDMDGASPEQMARLSQLLEARKQAEYEEFTGGGQGMPRQPALPEEQGIGQLPVGNMNFAGGGIVAFADGGDVERYSGEFGSLVEPFNPMTGVNPLTGTLYTPDDYAAPPDPASMRRVAASPYTSAPVSAEEAALLSRFPKPSAAPKATPKAKDNVAAESEGAPVMSGLSGLDALQKKYFGDFDTETKTIQGKRAEVVQGIKDLTAQNLADLEADIAARGDVYKNKEARLSKRKEEIEGMGSKYAGLALFKAGATILTTPGGIAAAVGRGAQVGAEQFAAGLDKINAAKSKFEEAQDRLDDLRINRDDMNAKERRAAKREARSAELKGQEFLLAGLEKDWGVKREVVGKLFTAAVDDLKTTKTINAQRQIALAKGGEDRMKNEVFQQLLAENNNNPVAAMAAYNKLMAKQEDLNAYYKKQQLDKLAEQKVKLAGMGGTGIPGQKESLDALERQLIGGGPVKATTKSQYDALPKGASYIAPDGTLRVKG